MLRARSERRPGRLRKRPPECGPAVPCCFQACVSANRELLLRPAGLADGLALKEPAPPLQLSGLAPKLGPPLPASTRGLGVSSVTSAGDYTIPPTMSDRRPGGISHNTSAAQAVFLLGGRQIPR